MYIDSQLFLSLEPGTTVTHANSTYIITNLLDIDNVLAKHLETGQIQRLRIAELKPNIHPISTESEGIIAPASTIPDEDWEEARKRFQIILPLLKHSNRSKAEVMKHASKYNISTGTLYRWMASYSATGTVSSLVRKGRADKGKGRISDEVEALIQNCVSELFLVKQRYSIPTVVEQITMRCKKANIVPPHPNTIRNRIAALAEEDVLKKRRGNKESRDHFAPIKGSFPGADYPLAVIQIDHTPIDIIIVDEVNRLPIGRPWITLAIDVFSRMVSGFYISLEHPSTMSVALCMAHSILPKEKWLANRGIAISWPVWGIPDTVHVDNAREFRGDTLKRACQEYGITLTWRPVATPHYGGHIERYLGTLMKDIHEIPGTTFSNPSERGEYDSDAKAILTLKELEKWITIQVLGRYHQRVHSEIGIPPIKKFELGILGDANTTGRGIPPRIQNEDRILLDFMPIVQRTIQDYGVLFENISYYSNILRRWINAKDPEQPKLKRKFTFRYDPRDISKLLFLDPELNIYYPIPYRTTSRPAISIWELREAIKNAKESYDNMLVDEDLIFSSYEKLREIERKASKETKATRRNAQQKLNTQSRKDYLPIATNLPQHPNLQEDVTEPLEEIKPFDDIDEDIAP
jgi:putative transposase